MPLEQQVQTVQKVKQQAVGFTANPLVLCMETVTGSSQDKKVTALCCNDFIIMAAVALQHRQLGLHLFCGRITWLSQALHIACHQHFTQINNTHK